MSLDKLDYILAIAEEQTLTRAAKKLYVSQPTLTNYINKLEEDLGVKLFDRSVTPVQVTRAGALYIEKMKKIQQESDNLRHALRQIGNNQRVFNLGIGNTRGNHWLPLIVPEFSQNHPDIVLQFHERGEEFLEKGVLKGEIDLAFGVLNTNYPELIYDEIATEEVFLAIPRSFECVSSLPNWQGTLFNPYYIHGEQIENLPFLLPYPGNGFYRCANMLLEQAKVHPHRIISYANMNTAYQLASAGVGALFVTVAFFDNLYPQCKQKLAFCSLQNPIYTRRSVAGFRPENPQIDLINELIVITKNKVVSALKELQTQ
ncbi:MAG: LysR family transcriptional regulator [Angelakisella sp.]|nr:LysR family transcriptional regulator [Angelakisella sp.]